MRPIEGLRMVTNFLPAGIINDQLTDIYESAEELERLVECGNQEPAVIARYLKSIKAGVREVRDIIERFSCQPLIYTGPGSTEEVIARLEWLLAFAAGDGNQPQGPGSSNRRKRRRKAPAGL